VNQVKQSPIKISMIIKVLVTLHKSG